MEEEKKGAYQPRRLAPADRKKSFWSEWGYLLVLAAVLLLLFKVIFQLSWVPSGSMETTIPQKTLLLSWQLPYFVSDPMPQRGDIVTFWSDELDKLLVKRVIGLPGDEVSFREGYVYINGELLEEPYLTRQGATQSHGGRESFVVPEGCLFFLGDNRANSNDARYWDQPFISVDCVRARVLLAVSVLPDSSWQGLRVLN